MIEIGSKSFREIFHVEGMAKEMMLMENPDYPTRTSHCHFALQLQSQCIYGLSSPKLLSSQTRCSFLVEWNLFLTWRVDFLVTFQRPCIEVKLTVQCRRLISSSSLPSAVLSPEYQTIDLILLLFVVQEMVTVGVDGSVLDRIAKIMSYLRLGSSGKVLKKKKKERDVKGIC